MAARGTPRPGSWNRASLVIHSETLTPEQISEALSALPDDSRVKGEPIGPRTPKPSESSFWAMDSTLGDDVRIEDQISDLLEFVSDHVDALTRLIDSQAANVRIQAAISDESGQYPMTFDADMLQRLAKVPLTLWLTAWMDSSSEKEAGDHG